ncbi:MAG: hypothetical protein R2826_07675 [Thermoleophilia bacterium]
MRRTRIVLLISALLLVVAASACGGTGGDDAGKASPTASAQTASAELLKDICWGAEDGVELEPVRGATVASASADMYYVAMEFKTKDGTSHVGLWATDNVDGGGTNVSVDDVAMEYTAWPVASDTDPSLNADDAEAKAALAAL